MATGNIKISELPSLSTMTDASEIPVVSSGNTQQITGANLKTYFTGNVGFSGDAVYDLNGMIIENADLSHGATAAVILPANGNTNPIQINNTYGNITIGAGANAAITSTYTLGNDGNITLPGAGTIANPANTSLDPLNPNVSTMVLTPDSNYSFQSLVLDPTAPGHIHLRAPSGTGNIDEPTANLFMGGELSSFEVGASYGGAPNVFVHSNGNTWAFDGTGNLTTPSSLTIGPVGSGNGSSILQYDAPMQLVSEGANGFVVAGWAETTSSPGNIAVIGFNAPYGNSASNVLIQTGNNGTTTYSWVFDNLGGTRFPTLSVSRGDNPSGTITGQTLLFNDNTQEAIITTPNGDPAGGQSSQRLVINPGAGADGTSGEGGDIYLWAGRGGSGDIANAVSGGSGGDIKIRGGQGGGTDGAGGYIRIEAGDSASGGGQAGYVYVTAGTSATQGGDANISAGYGGVSGGNAWIKGGFGGAGPGGYVYISGGVSANGAAESGNIIFTSGTSTWTMDNSGVLTLPSNTFAVNYANGTAVSLAGDYSDSNVVALLGSFGSNAISTTGNITAGNFVGPGSNVDIVAGSYDWTFANNGTLSAPGAISATGTITAQTLGAVGNITAGGALDIDGNARIGGNLFVVGNINFTGNVTQISGNSGVFYGDSQGVGAIFAGVPGYTPLPTAVAQFTGDAPDYIQINSQNINHANTSSMEYVITGDLGNDTTDYIDIGFSSSTWDGTQTNSLGTAVGARDGYVYVQGGGGGGNLVIGTTTPSRSIKFNVGGPNSANTVGQILSSGLSMVGNITAGGNVIATNIGNVAALNLNGNASTVLYGNGVFAAIAGVNYGDSNVVSLLGTFGSNTVSTTGNVTAGNLRTGGNIAFTANSSNILFNTGAYISGNANSISRDGSIVLSPYTGAGSTFPGVVIGGAGRLLASNGSVHMIFNVSDVTTQVASKITVGTAATSTTTGALQVTGGIGASGNIYSGGLVSVTGNITGGNINAGIISATGNVVVSGSAGVSQPNLPAFRVYGTSSSNIPAGTTVTSTQGATIDYNQGSYYNNTTGLFTAPVAGIYSATATVRVGSTGGLNQASIQKNSSGTGANVVAFWEVTGNTTVGHMSMSGTTKLAAGDTLRLQVVAGNINFDANDSWSVTFLG